jgi:translation elongation factor EF-1beta
MPMLCLRVLKHVLSDHFDVCLLHPTQVPHLLPVHQRVPLLAGTTQACPSSQEADSEELAAVVAQLEQKVASLDMVVEEQCDGIKKLNAEVSITDCLSESVCSVAFSHGLLMDSWWFRVTLQGGGSRCLKEGERVCSDAAQCENRGNSDLVARLDVRGYSSIHGLVNLNIALIIGVVKEDNGMQKIAGEVSCAGEGACCPEAVWLSDLKTANTVVCFI